MIGAEFTGVLHAAQQGRVSAFERLWADLHPGLIRYLRVVAVADADDIACESWVDVVRRLPTFEGDETAWRAQVFGAAKMHAEDENQRRVWDALAEDDEISAVLAEPLPPGDEPFEDDEVEGGPAQGLRLALEAIRDLPPEQGEVLMLRRVGELPESDVAALLGADVAAVHALEQQALDRLGLDAELLGWALSADPRPVELADEATVVGFFRAVVPEHPASAGTAVLTRQRRSVQPGSRAAGAVGAARPTGGARVITFRPPTWRARAGAIAAVSAGVIGLGAISAAAYQGVLPDPVQNVMHVVIGAPEPTPESGQGTASSAPHTSKAGRHATATVAGGPAPSGTNQPMPSPSAAGQGLCRAWAAQAGRPGAQNSSVYRSLVAAAGGADGVILFCAVNNVLVPPPPSATSPAGPATTATPQVTATSPAQPTATSKPPSTNRPTATKSVVPPKPKPSTPTTATVKPTPTTTSPTTTAVVPPTATTNGGGAPAGAGGNGGSKSTGAKGTGGGAAKDPAAGQAKVGAKAADGASDTP